MSATKPNGTNPQPDRSQVIRLGKGQAAKLEKLAEKFEVSQAQLVRWAVDALERKVNALGGKITLPLDFDTTGEPLTTLADDKVVYKAKGKKQTPAT